MDIGWRLIDDNNGQIVDAYDMQWRYNGQAWSAGTVVSDIDGTCETVTIADTTRGVQARVRGQKQRGHGRVVGTGSVSQSDVEDERRR